MTANGRRRKKGWLGCVKVAAIPADMHPLEELRMHHICIDSHADDPAAVARNAQQQALSLLHLLKAHAGGGRFRLPRGMALG